MHLLLRQLLRLLVHHWLHGWSKSNLTELCLLIWVEHGIHHRLLEELLLIRVNHVRIHHLWHKVVISFHLNIIKFTWSLLLCLILLFKCHDLLWNVHVHICFVLD